MGAKVKKRCMTVSVETAGRMLGISRGGAYAAVRSGQIPSIRIGRRLLVPKAQLKALLAGEREQEADAS